MIFGVIFGTYSSIYIANTKFLRKYKTFTNKQSYPYFLKSEMYHKNVDGHSQNGEMRVEKPRINWEILDAVQEAAEEIGISRTSDFNLGDNEGSGYFEVMQKTRDQLEPKLLRRSRWSRFF